MIGGGALPEEPLWNAKALVGDRVIMTQGQAFSRYYGQNELEIPTRAPVLDACETRLEHGFSTYYSIFKAEHKEYRGFLEQEKRSYFGMSVFGECFVVF